MNKGKITQVIGPVIDVAFEGGGLPNVLNSLLVEKNGRKIYLEVAGHLGLSEVRTIAMSSTDGLARGDLVEDTGFPISVPVGKEILGRIINVTGEPIDGKGEIKSNKNYFIHRSTPKFLEQSSKTEILETGIKIIDLI